MKTCGIIGGMGPDATSLFYMKLVRKFQCRESYPPVLLYSVPEPFKIADAWIRQNQGGLYLQNLLLDGVRLLGKRVGFIVIPCNTAHMFMQRIRQVATVPVLSMIEETCTYIQTYKKWKKVGILASTATVQSGLYSHEFWQKGIEPVLPEREQQDVLAKIIMHIVKGQILSEDRAAVQRMVTELLTKGAEGVILACTDLPVLLSESHANPVLLDTMDILADAASAWITEEAVEPLLESYSHGQSHWGKMFLKA